MADKTTLSFYGGAREVTGACYLLETPKAKILIDCGMFQGTRFCDERNRASFPFEASTIDAVILTHAHMDHIGRLPKLYKDGFRGKIFVTPPTADLAKILLEDGLWFVEKEAQENNEEPMYGRSDFERVITLFAPVEYHQKIELAEGVSFQLLNAGHILGSSMARFEINGKGMLFTGDLGGQPSVLMPSPEVITDAHILITESAYGNRTHKGLHDRALLLERAIEDVASMKGVLMMPVFATERTQDILFEMNEMLEYKRIPEVPVFVDSPLAIKATQIFRQYTTYYNDRAKEILKKDPHLFDFKKVKFTETKEESKAINDVPLPKVVLAGSGMMAGGRILHHAVRYLGDPNSILLLVGWQAAGSLGRRLLDKAREVKIRGEMIRVAAEIRVIDGYSAHADEEQLRAFIENTRDSLEKVFVVQGEPDASLHFMQVLRDHYGLSAVAPTYGEKFEL